MSDYIKREDVLSAFKNAISDVFEYDTYDELLLDEGISRERCQKIISNIPTSDVQEVKHGKWEIKSHLVPLPWDTLPFNYHRYDATTHSEYEDYWHCSNCNFEGSRDIKPTYKYCPNCGAKMDLEEEK